MTNADALDLIERYGKSWYNDVDHIDPRKIVDGGSVPIAEDEERLACLRENVDEAIWNRDGIRKRYEAAQRDGLFDLAALKTIQDKDIRGAWVMAIDTQRGDKGRCIAELRHWREYLAMAMSGNLRQHKRGTTMADIIRELAERKSA